MARTLGIPSRMAVGFVPGDQQPDGSWQVTGRSLHTWPELWLDGLGWWRSSDSPSGVPGIDPDPEPSASPTATASGTPTATAAPFSDPHLVNAFAARQPTRRPANAAAGCGWCSG